MKSKNLKLAIEFYEYCKANPDLRFWQALANWAKVNYILIAKNSSWYDNQDQKYNLTDTYLMRTNHG